METPFMLWMNIFHSRKVKVKYTHVVFFCHINIICFLYPQTNNLYYKSVCIYNYINVTKNNFWPRKYY